MLSGGFWNNTPCRLMAVTAPPMGREFLRTECDYASTRQPIVGLCHYFQFFMMPVVSLRVLIRTTVRAVLSWHMNWRR